MVSCPMCDAVIDVDEDELDEGDRLSCDECGASIRVSSVDPLEMESDDGDDEDEDFEDYEEDEEDEYDVDGEEDSDEDEEDW